MWQKYIPGPRFNWEDALAYAENLTFAGYDDWHLPILKELRSIVDYNRPSPAIDIFFFSEEPNRFWSSTNNADYPTSAWWLNSESGYSSWCNKFQSDPTYRIGRYTRAILRNTMKRIFLPRLQIRNYRDVKSAKLC